MDVVAHVERGAYRWHLTLEPRLNQIVAEARLLERPERVRDDEFAERETHGLAQEAVILPGQSLPKSVARKRAQGRIAGPLILLEHSTGQHNAGKPTRQHLLQDLHHLVRVLRALSPHLETATT